MTERSNQRGGFASTIFTSVTLPFSSINRRATTLPLEIPLRSASRGYSGWTREIGTIPRRTAGFGGAGGAGGATTGGASTGGSGGGVGVTAAMAGSGEIAGGGVSGGGVGVCCGGGG